MNNKMAKNAYLSTTESKNQTKQTRRTELFDSCQMEGGVWVNEWKGEGIKNYKQVVTE